MNNISSKVKVLAKGSALRSFTFLANCIIGLFMMPFIIHSLGDKMYGLWILIMSFIGFYGLLDIGLSSAVQKYVSRAIGVNDHENANSTISTSFYLFTILGLLVLFASVVAIVVAPFFIKNGYDISLFRKIIAILGISLAIGFPMRVFSGILTANLRYDITTGIELLKLFARTCLIITFLKLGYGIMALAFITFFIDIIGYIFYYIYSKKIVTYLVISRRNINKEEVKKLFDFSIFIFIGNIADDMRFNIDNFVIGAFLGLSFVTIYSIAGRLVKYFRDLVISAVGIMMPVFSQYEARNDYASLRDKYLFSVKLTIYLAMFIGGLLLIYGKPFIVLWVGEKYLSAYAVLAILVMATILDFMQGTKVALLQALSKHKFYAFTNIAEGIANLCLSLILVTKLGMVGVALGTAIPMLITKIFVQPIYICKILDLKMRFLYFDIILPSAFKSMLAMSSFFLISKLSTQINYYTILIQSFLACVVFSIIVFTIGLTSIEKSYFKKALFAFK